MNSASFLPYSSAICAGLLAIGALIRPKRSVADWSFFTGMAVLAFECICLGMALGATHPDRFVLWHSNRLMTLSLVPGTWLLFSLSYARGNARESIRRWRIPLALAFALPIGTVLAFRPGLVAGVVSKSETTALVRLVLGWPGIVLFAILLVGSVVVLMNLERTFRAAVGTMRWRIKFMLLGVGLIFIVRIYTSSQALLFRSVEPGLAALNAAGILLGTLLILRSVFRTRLSTVDVYPSESVLQGSATVILAGAYLLIVGLFAKFVSYAGGGSGSGFAFKTFIVLVSIVVLAVLLQSDRLRLHLRRFVSRHFQRPFFDYRTVWRKFTEGTASKVEQPELSRALVRLVAETFQALSVSLWLVDARQESLTLAASTSLTDAKARDLSPQPEESAAILQRFRDHAEPVDIESETAGWATALRRWQPLEFPNGGRRVCVPLVGRKQFLGLLVVGDRVSGAEFSVQDFDMLKCVGDHAAGSLLNIQLSQRLLQAKELEAFQAMATFFVHDLKNAASTLGLMLQNLPNHFDDPEFRKDALRGIGNTVGHINHLVGRLSSLRHELKINAVSTDLNDLASSSISALETAPSFTLVKDFGDVPRIAVDAEQIRKVITNLVLNAAEAMPAQGGRIRISTGTIGGWAVLTVEDTGVGMSPEFLSRSLFRPFQTTKKRGLGIGMFQSKMIVEAHGGRINVESRQNEGTKFEVLLPLNAAEARTNESQAPFATRSN